MKKNPKRIPFVKETVLVLSLQSARGGDLDPPFTTTVQVSTVSDECPPAGYVAA
jgi:hypothetical protein